MPVSSKQPWRCATPGSSRPPRCSGSPYNQTTPPQSESSLQEVVSLLGVEAIAAEQRITLRLGQALREDLLQQDSFDPVDASCPPARLLAMLRVVHAAEAAMSAALARGVAIPDIIGATVLVPR